MERVSIWPPVLQQFSGPGIFATHETVIYIYKKVACRYLLVGSEINYFVNEFVNKSRKGTPTLRHTVSKA